MANTTYKKKYTIVTEILQTLNARRCTNFQNKITEPLQLIAAYTWMLMSGYLSKISSRGDKYILKRMGARTDPCVVVV